MDLTSEDSFRLNVLLANRPLAIRIDEHQLIVQGLNARGESTVRLHPQGRADRYLRRVRELISGQVLGSPGGYPVYLQRWTRMGQMRDESLEQLLLLGEPEAVVAAAGAPGLTDELARRAWWAMEDAENARRMLANPAVVAGAMGRVLVDYLIDYLPFETASERIMDSVALILGSGLATPEQCQDLWRKSGRRQAYLAGFLRALPDDLPDPPAGHPLPEGIAALATAGHPVAVLLRRVYRPGGQAYVKATLELWAKLPNQEVLTASFDCLRDYFSRLRPEGNPDLPLADLLDQAGIFAQAAGAEPALREAFARQPALADDVAAMHLLGGLGYGVIRPVLPDPTVEGTLMRRKLTPILDPIRARLGALLKTPFKE